MEGIKGLDMNSQEILMQATLLGFGVKTEMQNRVFSVSKILDTTGKIVCRFRTVIGGRDKEMDICLCYHNCMNYARYGEVSRSHYLPYTDLLQDLKNYAERHHF